MRAVWRKPPVRNFHWNAVGGSAAARGARPILTPFTARRRSVKRNLDTAGPEELSYLGTYQITPIRSNSIHAPLLKVMSATKAARVGEEYALSHLPRSWYDTETIRVLTSWQNMEVRNSLLPSCLSIGIALAYLTNSELE